MNAKPWIIVIVGLCSACADPPDETKSVVVSAESSGLCDPDILPGKELAPGVKYYDCTSRSLFDVRAHIVTVDRTLPAMEIRLLTDPASLETKRSRGTVGGSIVQDDEFWLNLQRVDTFARRAGAIAAVNGFVWDGDSGKTSSDQPAN